MKISEIRDVYYEATAKVSDVVRQLAFAGIAVVWIFRVGDKTGGITYSATMLWPLGLFVGCLAFDLAQYLYKSLIWGTLNTVYWRKYRDKDKDIPVSGAWNYPTVALFWLKAVCAAGAYGCLLASLAKQM